MTRRPVAFSSGIDAKVEALLDALDRELDLIEDGSVADVEEAVGRLRGEALKVRRAFLAEQTLRAE